MLSGADSLSVTYQPLFDQIVDHLKMTPAGTPALGDPEDVKVAHVKATDEAFLANTADYIETNLIFNGQHASENLDAGLYEPITIESWYTNQLDPRTDAINRVLDFGPHIVIGTTSAEMFDFIIPGVEDGWDAKYPGKSRPFYMLSALNNADAEPPHMLGEDDSIAAGQTPLYQRILGINWPAAVDKTIYNAYLDRFDSFYGQAVPGWENLYDGTYYLMYAVAAARLPLNGTRIANGLLRVTSTLPASPVVEVGPNNDMVKYVTDLSTDTDLDIQLLGAQGPPSWDDTGTRHDAGSVWCLNTVGAYHTDQLRYVPGSPATLSGAVDCFEFDGVPVPTVK